jgi:hypothetical protein
MPLVCLHAVTQHDWVVLKITEQFACMHACTYMQCTCSAHGRLSSICSKHIVACSQTSGVLLQHSSSGHKHTELHCMQSLLQTSNCAYSTASTWQFYHCRLMVAVLLLHRALHALQEYTAQARDTYHAVSVPLTPHSALGGELGSAV